MRETRLTPGANQ